VGNRVTIIRKKQAFSSVMLIFPAAWENKLSGWLEQILILEREE